MIRRRIESALGTVWACYWGGEYIELTFGDERKAPAGVINVWDYEKGASTIELSDDAVDQSLNEWIAETDGHDLREYFRQ